MFTISCAYLCLVWLFDNMAFLKTRHITHFFIKNKAYHAILCLAYEIIRLAYKRVRFLKVLLGKIFCNFCTA